MHFVLQTNLRTIATMQFSFKSLSNRQVQQV